MNLNSKKDVVFLVLAGFFITNALVAEMIGGKVVMFFGTFVQSVGIVLWPVVFVLTDIVNEFYGQSGVRKLSYITLGLIAFTFTCLLICIHIPAIATSPVSDENFRKVFGQSMYIMIGSMTAFIVSQFVDSGVFWMLRNRTGKKMIWLRSTGSTVVSQLVDTFVVQFIAFVIPGYWTIDMYLHNASWGYVFKLLTAFLVIPVIYLVHRLIDKYLGDEISHDMIQDVAEKNLHHKVKE